MTISKELLYIPSPKDNAYPIIIRVRHLGKEKILSTNIHCLSCHWDPLTESVSDVDSKASLKNEALDTIFRRVAGNIQKSLDEFLSLNLDSIIDGIPSDSSTSIPEQPSSIPETPSSIPGHLSVSPGNFRDLIDRKIKSVSNLNTRRGYMTFRRWFDEKIGPGPSPSAIDGDFIANVQRQLENDFNDLHSSRRLFSVKLKTVINFGKEAGWIDSRLKVKMPRYHTAVSDYNLSHSEISEIYSLFRKHISRDPSMKRLETLSLALFILEIAFQGLAPVDMARLRVGDILLTSIPLPDKIGDLRFADNHTPPHIEVAIVKTFRKKTGIPVSIVADTTLVGKILESLMKDKCDDDYLLPCFSKDKTYTPEKRQNRLANFFNLLAARLNDTLGTIGFTRRVTYYFARHAFCNLVDSLDVPRHIIQHLIGHRTTVLERSYLRTITPSEQAYISHRIYRLLDCP